MERKKVTFNLELNTIHIIASDDDSRNGRIWLLAAVRRKSKKTKLRPGKGKNRKEEQDTDETKHQQGTSEITEEGETVFIPRNGLFI